MKKCRLVLGITLLGLILPLAGPSDVSAFPINLGVCTLTAGGDICDLGSVQFNVTQVNGNSDPASDPRIGQAYAKVGVVVEAIDPGDFQQNVVEFEYRYQITDLHFAINQFFLFPLVPPYDPNNLASQDQFGNPLILDVGSIPDADSGTVAPLTTTYSGPGIFLATFSNGSPQAPGEGPITPNKVGSDVLFIRSSLSPVDIFGTLDGTEIFDALFSLAELKGPGQGSGIVATAILPASTATPEPSTLILLGSGLLGLAVARLRRRRK